MIDNVILSVTREALLMLGGAVPGLSVAVMIPFVVSWLYCTLFDSSEWQATPGKAVIGLLVTDLRGKRISFARANVRFWGMLVFPVISWIGLIMAGLGGRFFVDASAPTTGSVSAALIEIGLFVFFLGFTLTLVDFNMVSFTRKKQTFHDMMAGCLVIRKAP